MRFGSFLTVTAIVLCSVTSMAAAQNSPVYVPMTSQQGYGTTQSGTIPLYNNMAAPLPMDQMVAGKNAPSYNYNAPKPYNLNPTTYGSGVMTAEQVEQMRADRNARAQQYQQEYLQQMANQQMPQQAQQALNGASNYYNNMTGQQQPQKPKKKRLVHREDTNPLQAPPRLFNID